MPGRLFFRVLALLVLLSAVDTITPPNPVAAITVNENGNLVCLINTQDELYIFDDEVWSQQSLPLIPGLVDRFLIYGDLCYTVTERSLILVDLEKNMKSTIAEDIDDAVINSYGELVVLSDFTLRRLSSLGRELEEETLTDIDGWMWLVADTVIFSSFPPFPSDFFPSGCPEFSLSNALAPSNVAVTEESIFILSEPLKILRIYQ